MADALADLLHEIENMRKERGELRTKNAALEAQLAKLREENKKLRGVQPCGHTNAAITQTADEGTNFCRMCDNDTLVTALEAELTKTKAELAVTKFDLDKIRERNVKNVLALNALQKSTGEAAEKIRNSDAVRYYTRFHCADELKQIASDLEVAVRGEK